MSPNLLQGKRVRRCPTEEETGDSTKSGAFPGEDKSEEVPVENYCETATRNGGRDRDFHFQQSPFTPTGKVETEVNPNYIDL